MATVERGTEIKETESTNPHIEMLTTLFEIFPEGIGEILKGHHMFNRSLQRVPSAGGHEERWSYRKNQWELTNAGDYRPRQRKTT